MDSRRGECILGNRRGTAIVAWGVPHQARGVKREVWCRHLVASSADLCESVQAVSPGYP